MTQIYPKIKKIILDKASIALRIDRCVLHKVNFNVEKPNEEKNGEISTNISLVIQKEIKQKPSEIANKIISELKKCPEFLKVEFAMPGFINLWLDKLLWQDYLKESLCLTCLLYTSPSPRDATLSRMPSSA